MTWYETTIAVIGAIGGFEALKYICNLIFNRKNNARIADAEADASEFHILQEELIFLQEQVKEKEIRFSEQTTHLRQVQRELLALEKDKSVIEVEYIKKIASLEIELEKKRCDDLPCPFRLPPNAHTQAKLETTKNTYFDKRKNDSTESISAQV